MSWRSLREEAAAAARALRITSRRGAVSRLYQAVYYLAADRVDSFGPFKGSLRWRNPPHDEVPGLLMRLPGISTERKKKLRQNFKELYKKRVGADYRPDGLIDETLLREMFKKAEEFAGILGEKL